MYVCLYVCVKAAAAAGESCKSVEEGVAWIFINFTLRYRYCHIALYKHCLMSMEVVTIYCVTKLTRVRTVEISLITDCLLFSSVSL